MDRTSTSRASVSFWRIQIAPVWCALLLLTACGGDTGSTSTTPAPPPPSPAPAPPPEPPAVPTGLRISGSGEDFVEWTWNAVEGADGYDVQFSLDEAFASEDEIIARTAQELSYRRDGLAAGLESLLRVRSAAGTGQDRITSAWSAPVAGSTTASDRPAVPGGLRISAIGPDFIEWSWTPVAEASGYDIHFSTNEQFTDGEIIARSAAQTLYRREGLAAWTSAYLRVRSAAGTGQDRITSLWSAPVTGSTASPDSPHLEHHAVLTAGLSERPFVNATVGGTEGSTKTVGTLGLGLNPDVFPVVVMPGDAGIRVLVAGSRLGAGRVVAFSGQDFLSPGTRATLLGNASAARLLANAVRWAGDSGDAAPRVIADNQRVADALGRQGVPGVELVGNRDGYRDWSADALAEADVAVVLTNDWGTARLVADSVAPLRAFVERGGGLVVAGSAFHWSLWIEHRHGPFTGNLLLRGAGIQWNEDSIAEIEAATTDIDLAPTPAAVWGAYLGGGSPDPGMLPDLFESALELGRVEELDAALVRLVRETPPLPASANSREARLAAEVASTLGPHEWPETHPWAATFPGLPDSRARRVTGSVTVDATWGEFPADARRRERRLPLGFYAPPGGLVTISVPASHISGELAVEAGQEYDDLRFIERHTEWRRAPALRRVFPIHTPETAGTNAYGGSLALVVPESYSGTIPVTVEGAIPMAVYTAGRSSLTEWRGDLNAGAPQAIIQKLGGIRLVVSAEAAHDISDPSEVSAFWDGFRSHHAELASEPVERAYESVWTFDPHVGSGYANANWLTINYPLYGEHWALLPGTAEGRQYISTLRRLGPQRHRRPPSTGYSPQLHGVDWWLFGHELGHQWQTGDWGGAEIGEVAVNLFTMYTLNYYVYGGDDFNVYTELQTHDCAAPINHAALASQRWSTAGHCQRLALYRQLIGEFGWEPMQRVFHSYYDPAYPRSRYGGHLDGFAIRFSAVVQRDLVSFFRRWEYPLSGSAEATIREFGFEVWLPPGW